MFVLMHDPVAGSAGQSSTGGALQVQSPPAQVPSPQPRPQEPQWFGSVPTSTQALPQNSCPTGQVQVPLTHRAPE